MKQSMHARLTFVFALAAPLLLNSVIGATTATAAPSPQPDPAQRVEYAVDLSELPGAKISIAAGEKKDGGCVFSGAGQGSPGAIVVVTELSYDPATCTHELATATYTAATAPDSVTRLISSQLADGDSATPSPDGQGTVTPMATYAHSARLWARIQDPVNATTTETGVYLQWNTTSTTVGTYTSSHELNWLSGTGWQKTSDSATRGRTSSTKVWANTKGTFKNPTFCKVITGGSGPTTYADHSKTWLEGRLAGGSGWSYVMDKSGGCANLLHYHYVYLP